MVDASVLEVGGTVALPRPVPPVPGVVLPVELVVGEVVDEAPAVGNLGVAEALAAFYRALVQTGIQVVFVEEKLK